MLKFREWRVSKALSQRRELTRAGIDAMRRDADEAEAVLRELGKWE